MELNITELEEEDDELFYDDDFDFYNNKPINSSFEQIPENTAPIKIIKNVRFDETSVKPMHQSIPKTNAKITRPHIPPKKPQISYEDILSKMGMLVSNGKLHLIDRNTVSPHLQEEITRNINNSQSQYYKPSEQNNTHQQLYQQVPQQVYQQVPQQNKNSYIFNKYFKDELIQHEQVRRPRTIQEYRTMLIKDFIQKQRIKQIKSTKLIMPTSNINMATVHNGNIRNLQNKLFNFSKR
jgi:hypothetical protein